MSKPAQPEKFSSAPCPRCGSPASVVNPAWLRQTRIAARVTLREMARRMSFSAPYLSDVEHGRRTAGPHIVKFYEEL